jgi:hypothetical protein
MPRNVMNRVEGKRVVWWRLPQLPDWDATLNRSEVHVEQV